MVDIETGHCHTKYNISPKKSSSTRKCIQTPPQKRVSKPNTIKSKDDLDLLRLSTTFSQDRDDPMRVEMMWAKKQETYLTNIAQECNLLSKTHERLGRRYRRFYMALSVPSVVLPLVIGTIETLDKNVMLVTVGMTCVSILSGLSTFLDFGRKSESHYTSEQDYSDLESEITLTLVKPRAFRIPADVFLERVNHRFSTIHRTSPNIIIARKSFDRMVL